MTSNNDSIVAESRLYALIYAALLSLTAITVGISLLHFERVAAIVTALAVASIKGGLILWHFMHMKSERPLIWIILLVGLTAVLILGIGVLPDLGWR